MTDEPAETPKRDANENPWYRLATLYGEPASDDRELQARNRVAWNRFMAGRLTGEARAKLMETGRYSAEELRPPMPDELGELTVTHIFLLWAKDLISLADLAASDSRARERTCSMKPVIGPRPSSGRPTLGMQDAPTVW